MKGALIVGKSLWEYADQNPQQEPQPELQAEGRNAWQEAVQNRETVAQIKAGITQQLAQGNEPQYILYSALQAIGILTNDREWMKASMAALDSVYSDLAQQSLLAEESSLAADRLAEQRAAYIQQTRKQLQQNLAKLQKMQEAVIAARAALNLLEGSPAIETP